MDRITLPCQCRVPISQSSAQCALLYGLTTQMDMRSGEICFISGNDLLNYNTPWTSEIHHNLRISVIITQIAPLLDHTRIEHIIGMPHYPYLAPNLNRIQWAMVFTTRNWPPTFWASEKSTGWWAVFWYCMGRFKDDARKSKITSRYYRGEL